MDVRSSLKRFEMNFKTWRFWAYVAYLVLSASALAQTPSPTITPITINQTNVPIRVDGHLNDWPEARVFYLGRRDQITLGNNFWKGEDDFNGRIFLTYDAQYLYIAAIVQKAGGIAFTNDTSSLKPIANVVNSNDPISLWNGDCVELFLSTRPNFSSPSHLARGDYHIGLSPGNECRNPQMYCFNRDETIPGSRLVARMTLKGYLMEACIPLAYFQGLDLGPGKDIRLDAALDKGGDLSGYRIIQMDYAGKETDPEDPSTWPEVQWAGDVEQEIPFQQAEDLYAGLVQDGTRGDTYAGVRTITGMVQDMKGKPLSGVYVSTWPKTKQVQTDSQGMFQLEKIKTYDKTVFYGRQNGYVVSVLPLVRGAKAVTLQMSPLPAALGPSLKVVSPYFFGLSLPAVVPDQFDTMATRVKPLNPGLVCLNLASSNASPEEGEPLLDKFAAWVQQIGAEPMVAVPINRANPEAAGQWVHYANVEKNYKIRFWAVGNEPDTGVKGVENYNAYDYVNDFRSHYNTMKREDPSIVILGPEVASKYSRGEDDWITPFLRYDGDIVEGVSIHRYAALQGNSLPVSIRADLHQETSMVQALRDKVSQNTDFEIPLMVTGEKACAEAVTSKSADEAVTLGFWEALWEADKKGSFLNGHMALDASFCPSDMAAGVSFQAPPTYWVLKLWGQMIRGKVIAAQIQNPQMSVYATQDPKTKDVTVMVINKGDRYWRPKFMLDGENTDLSVDAGLNERYDFEVPSYSISCLKLKADRSTGASTVYTLKMAQKGQEPQVSALKPW
jgi:hypothetical protein